MTTIINIMTIISKKKWWFSLAAGFGIDAPLQQMPEVQGVSERQRLDDHDIFFTSKTPPDRSAVAQFYMFTCDFRCI